MALVNAKVYNDGSHYYALFSFADARRPEKRGSRFADPKFDKFKEYYKEASDEKLKGKKMMEYIQERYWEDAEDIIEDLPTDAQLADYKKRHIKSMHAKKDRYNKKAFFNMWNWFITFTYDDDKTTYEEFETKIKKALSNLSSRNDWLYMAAPELGEENGRRHFHVLARVEEGKMPGQLETRAHYSTKKRRMVYYTANTLFDKYGLNDFSAISDPTECRNKISYLIKYVFKQNGKVIYSRGIKEYVEMVVDTEKDIATVYKAGHGSRRAVLFDSFFESKDKKGTLAKMKGNSFRRTEDPLGLSRGCSMLPFHIGPVVHNYIRRKEEFTPAYTGLIYNPDEDIRRMNMAVAQA